MERSLDPRRFSGWLDALTPQYCLGWAWHPALPSEPIEVLVFDDERLLGRTSACFYHPGLGEQGFGDGRKGFVFFFPEEMMDGRIHTIQVKFAGTDRLLPGTPLSITFPGRLRLESAEAYVSEMDAILATVLPWGGIDGVDLEDSHVELCGWVVPPAEDPGALQFLLNGRPMDEVRCAIAGDHHDFPGMRLLSRFTCRSHLGKSELFRDRQDAVLEILHPEASATADPHRAHHFLRPDVDPYPLPDPDRRMRVAGYDDPGRFRRGGYTNFKLLEQILHSTLGRTYRDVENVLDWGCGCGRLSRYFHPLGNLQLTGADIDLDNISWCQRHLPGGQYVQAQLNPPLPLPDNHFDLIIGLSVFTHLQEPDQLDWLGELVRVSAPGCALLLTVNGAVSMTQMPYNSAATLYDRWRNQGFVMSSLNSQLDGLVKPGYYSNVFHTESYIRQVWSRYFEVVAFLPGAVDYQDLVVLRRKT